MRPTPQPGQESGPGGPAEAAQPGGPARAQALAARHTRPVGGRARDPGYAAGRPTESVVNSCTQTL